MIKSLFLGVVTTFLFVEAIGSDTSSTGNFVIERNLEPIPTQKTSIYREIGGFWATSGSNSVPLAMASKFITGGYISPDEMEHFESKLHTNNRMGYIQDMSVSVYPIPGISQPNDDLAVKQITVGTISMGGMSFTKDAFGIFFRGNTPYLGERKEMGNNEFLQLRQRYIDFSIQLPFKSKKWNFYSDVKLSQVLDFNRAHTNNLFLETDKNADSIILGGNFYSQQTAYDFLGTGVGLQGGFGARRSVKQGFLSLSVTDFGFLSVNNVQRQSRGFSWDGDDIQSAEEFSVKDVNIQSVGLTGTDIKVSNWFDRQRDTVESRLNIEEDVQRGMVLSPFIANVSYYKYKVGSIITGYRLGLNYIHMVGYTPRFSGEISWRPIGNVNLNHGVSFGGFDTFDVNSSVSFNAGSFNGQPFLFNIYLRGIESLLVPSELHGGGIGIQIYYPFGG